MVILCLIIVLVCSFVIYVSARLVDGVKTVSEQISFKKLYLNFQQLFQKNIKKLRQFIRYCSLHVIIGSLLMINSIIVLSSQRRITLKHSLIESVSYVYIYWLFHIWTLVCVYLLERKFEREKSSSFELTVL